VEAEITTERKSNAVQAGLFITIQLKMPCSIPIPNDFSCRGDQNPQDCISKISYGKKIEFQDTIQKGKTLIRK